jgi:hypothetical protein
MPTTPYADLTFAAAYFPERMESCAWDAATGDLRLRALRAATRLIDTLNFIGYKTVTDGSQAREFPRNGETEIPLEVKEANCEVALAFLAGKSLDGLDYASGVQSESVGDASVSYGPRGKGTLLMETAGTLSQVAGRLLNPWLVDPRAIRLERVG